MCGNYKLRSYNIALMGDQVVGLSATWNCRCWQMASQGDDDESPHAAASGQVRFQIGAAVGSAAGPAQQQPPAAPAGVSLHEAGGRASQQYYDQAHDAQQQQQPHESPRHQQKPNFWATTPVRLADFARNRNGVHQEDVMGDELLPEAPADLEEDPAFALPKPRGNRHQK